MPLSKLKITNYCVRQRNATVQHIFIRLRDKLNVMDKLGGFYLINFRNFSSIEFRDIANYCFSLSCMLSPSIHVANEMSYERTAYCENATTA